mmetsp:Transcript_16463/g.42196  ORF Transcript_16463/g.42196 Transcript_16463/m.42196 type:complete len:261 (-) Transcript_16463:414-1196(-)
MAHSAILVKAEPGVAVHKVQGVEARKQLAHEGLDLLWRKLIGGAVFGLPVGNSELGDPNGQAVQLVHLVQMLDERLHAASPIPVHCDKVHAIAAAFCARHELSHPGLGALDGGGAAEHDARRLQLRPQIQSALHAHVGLVAPVGLIEAQHGATDAIRVLLPDGCDLLPHLQQSPRPAALAPPVLTAGTGEVAAAFTTVRLRARRPVAALGTNGAMPNSALAQVVPPGRTPSTRLPPHTMGTNSTPGGSFAITSGPPGPHE